MIRIHWVQLVGFGLSNLILGAIIGLNMAPANASVTDTPTRICAELHQGHPMRTMWREMEREGYGETEAGRTIGFAVRDHCFDLKDAVIAEAEMIDATGGIGN